MQQSNDAPHHVATHHLTQQFERLDLYDRAGNQHAYNVFYHDPDRAVRLCLRMAQAGGLSLSRVLEANLPAIATAVLAGGLEGLDSDEIKRRLATAAGGALKDGQLKLDAATLLGDLFNVLLACDDEGLLLEVFTQTQRDGQPLKDRAIFNHVYRANYGELRAAFIAIFNANGFADFLFGGASSANAQPPVIHGSPTTPTASPSSASGANSATPSQ